MPAKRKPRSAQPLPQQSDYETDTANYTDNQLAPLPAPPVRSIGELNLIVLKRWYPDIQHVIAIAPYAVLYNLNATAGEWEKAETEGSLFVCQLTDNPYERYRVVIMNRKSLENFSLDLVGTDSIQFESGYIMAQVTEDDICGIWVFSDGDTDQNTAETIWNVIETCAKRAAHFRDAAEVDDGAYDNGSNGLSYAQDRAHAYEEPQHFQHSAPAWQDTHNATEGQPVGGQQIDLASLFKPPEAQQAPHGTYNQGPAANHFPSQPGQSTNKTDTSFFRGAEGNHAPAFQQTAPQPQQAALLDLFRNAKRG